MTMARTSIKKVWVARDGDGDLFAYENKPFYVVGFGGIWLQPRGAYYKVKNLLFEHLKCDDEPIQTEILSTNLVRLA